jgi:hypothetical protein
MLASVSESLSVSGIAIGDRRVSWIAKFYSRYPIAMTDTDTDSDSEMCNGGDLKLKLLNKLFVSWEAAQRV